MSPPPSLPWHIWYLMGGRVPARHYRWVEADLERKGAHLALLFGQLSAYTAFVGVLMLYPPGRPGALGAWIGVSARAAHDHLRHGGAPARRRILRATSRSGEYFPAP